MDLDNFMEFTRRSSKFDITNLNIRESCNDFNVELEKYLREQKEHIFYLEHKQSEDVSSIHFSTKKDTLRRRYKSLIKEKDEMKKELLNKINVLRASQKQVRDFEVLKSRMKFSIQMKRLEIEMTKEQNVGKNTSSDDPVVLGSEIERLKSQKNELTTEIDSLNEEITKNEDILKDEEEKKQISESKTEIYFNAMISFYKKSLEKVKKQVKDCKKSLAERNSQIDELDRHYGEIEDQIGSSQELLDDNMDDISNYSIKITEYLEEVKHNHSDGEVSLLKSEEIDEVLKGGIKKIENLESEILSLHDEFTEELNFNNEKYNTFSYGVEQKISEFESIQKTLSVTDFRIRNELEIYEAMNLLSDTTIESRITVLKEFLKKNILLTKRVKLHLSTYLEPLDNFVKKAMGNISALKTSKLEEIAKKESSLKAMRKRVTNEITKKLGKDAGVQFAQRSKRYDDQVVLFKKIDGLHMDIVEVAEQSNEEMSELHDAFERRQRNRRKKKKKEFTKNLILEFQEKIQKIFDLQTSNLKEIEDIVSSGEDMEDEESVEVREKVNSAIDILRGKIRESQLKLKYVDDKIRIISRKYARARSQEKKEKSQGEEHVMKLESEIDELETELSSLDDKINREEEQQEDEDELDYERELVVEKEVDLFTLESQIEEKNIPRIEIPQKLRPKIVIMENEDSSDFSESPQIVLVVPSPSANRKRSGLMSPAPLRSGDEVFKI